MLEHLKRKKVLRAKILMQNVLKGQIPPAKLYRGAMYRSEVLRACFRHFLQCFHFIRNLQISTQESNANFTKMYIQNTIFNI